MATPPPGAPTHCSIRGCFLPESTLSCDGCCLYGAAGHFFVRVVFEQSIFPLQGFLMHLRFRQDACSCPQCSLEDLGGPLRDSVKHALSLSFFFACAFLGFSVFHCGDQDLELLSSTGRSRASHHACFLLLAGMNLNVAPHVAFVLCVSCGGGRLRHCVDVSIQLSSD